MDKLETITIKEATEIVGGNEELLQEMLDKFRQWLQQQLHLPQEISDNQLRYTLLTSKFDLEKAKKRLDSLYTLRNLIPEFFADYDPLSESITRVHKYIQWVLSPKLTSEKYRVSVFRWLCDNDPSRFKVPDVFKFAFMITDIRVEEDVVNSEIIVVDATHLTLGYISKYTPSIVRKGNFCLEAYGLRIKAIYVINAPAFFEKLLSIIKMIMNPKIINRIRILGSGVESLYEYVPKSILPSDYGGKAPSMDTLTDMWRAKLMERRGWLLKQEKLKTNESLRADSVIDPDDLFGVAGTFRKLEID